jgi:plastocyanin
MRRVALLAPVAAAALVLAACGGGGGGEAEQASPTSPTDSAQAAPNAAAARADRTDPRDEGFEIALGEWALTAESEAIRPGRTTFVVTNRGKVPHGFEIEREDVEDDASKVETRILKPGESVEVKLDLPEGVYKLECNVEGHDDMGMEMLLEVRADAPMKAARSGKPSGTKVGIEGFAFAPTTIRAAVGDEIAWTNHDPADHTVTAENGGFDSGTMASGATFKMAFDSPGEYRYICALHPGMKGTVVVTR